MLTRNQEILAKYRDLSEEHGNLKNDYLSEREIRRSYQTAVQEKQNLVGDYERQLVRYLLESQPCRSVC